MPERVGLILDGGFIKKKLQERNGHFPTVREVVNLYQAILAHDRLQGKKLFRVYYYDSPPFEKSATNPIDGSEIDFATTRQARQNKSLLDALELQPDFAVRRGGLVLSGWELGPYALKSLVRKQRPLTAKDVIPNFEQKGVDIRIGLDIAWIALKGIVDTLVLVTGDSDFVPPMKFARKEGIRIYLETLGHGVRRELKAHADFVLKTRLNRPPSSGR